MIGMGAVLENLTDRALESLALAGCGAKLKSLFLGGMKDITDAGIEALASAGCGWDLTSVTLSSEFEL